MRNILSLHLASYTLVLTLLLSACGGGGGDAPAQPPVQPPPAQQWPQSVAFTDFTGGQTYFLIGGYIGGLSQIECPLCVGLRGIARSNAEMAILHKDSFNTPTSWPAPYNDKPYGELPIDYNSKMAVILQDNSSGRNRYTFQKVEEFADAITVSVVKCDSGFPLISFPQVVFFGLLLPKSSKPVQVVTLPSPNPPVPGQLGDC